MTHRVNLDGPEMTPLDEKSIVRTVAGSLKRIGDAKQQVASSVATKSVARHVNGLAKPTSPSSALRKAGVTLIVAAPDPISDVAGAALVATSYAMKRREPSKLDDLAAETKKILREMQSLRL